MMKMKKEYETPLLSVCRIEMESGFCSASAEVKNPDSELGRINEQNVESGFMSGGSFTDDWIQQAN